MCSTTVASKSGMAGMSTTVTGSHMRRCRHPSIIPSLGQPGLVDGPEGLQQFGPVTAPVPAVGPEPVAYGSHW